MEENKKDNKYKSFMTVIITALITCIITTILIYNYFLIRTGEARENNIIANAINNIVSSII